MRKPRNQDELVEQFSLLLKEGLRQSSVLAVLASEYSQSEMEPIVARARAMYEVDSDDDIEIDESPIFSETDSGTWVSAWLWVPNPDADLE